MKNILLKILGSICLLLGGLGAFLPLLPSTCFILLAAWSFNRSSPRFHDWLVRRSPFAGSIQNWQRNKSIARKVKVIATLSLVSSFLLTAWMLPNPLLLTSLGIAMAALLAYLLTRPDEFSRRARRNTQANSECRHELNQLIT